MKSVNIVTKVIYIRKVVFSNRTNYFFISEQKKSKPVAFTATTSRNLWTSKWERLSVIVFDYVITNVGGAYNVSDGKFTTPEAGIYCFTWTTLTLTGYSFESMLYRNGRQVYPLYAHANARYDGLDSASNLVSLSLSEGDMVWVAYVSGGYLDTGASSFSGWRLIPENRNIVID